MLKITLLTENTVRKRDLLAEHGLSLWIEHDRTRILFDTGQTDVYCKNAEALGIDLHTAQAIVISHGHYDHGGGLPDFPQAGLPDKALPAIYIHPEAFDAKYSASRQQDEPPRAIGFPWEKQDLNQLGKHLVQSQPIQEIGHNLYLCSGIEATNDFELPQPTILKKVNGQFSPDPMRDEQVLVCTCAQGMVIILGCSHPGVVNSIEQVRKILGDLPVLGVIGGMHLENVSPERLQKTLDYFAKIDLAKIVPLHCTGSRATQAMIKRFGDRIIEAHVGDTVVFKSPDE